MSPDRWSTDRLQAESARLAKLTAEARKHIDAGWAVLASGSTITPDRESTTPEER